MSARDTAVMTAPVLVIEDDAPIGRCLQEYPSQGVDGAEGRYSLDPDIPGSGPRDVTGRGPHGRDVSRRRFRTLRRRYRCCHMLGEIRQSNASTVGAR